MAHGARRSTQRTTPSRNESAESAQARSRQASRRVREESERSPTRRSRRAPQTSVRQNDENTPLEQGTSRGRIIRFRVHEPPRLPILGGALSDRSTRPQSQHATSSSVRGHSQSGNETDNPRVHGVRAREGGEGTGGNNGSVSNAHQHESLPKARRPYRDTIRQHTAGRMSILCPHCGACHWLDERRSDSSRREPKFGTCCNSGRVSLPALPDPPLLLQHLLTGNDAQCKEFRTNIRRYNAAFAFTSLGVKVDNHINLSGQAPYIFRIHGEMYHQAGALIPSRPGEQPRYSQLYIYDPAMATNIRAERNEELRRDTLSELENMLRSCNQYVSIYRHAYDVLSSSSNQDDVSVRLIVHASQDPRRYNLPTADDVAVLLPGDGEPSAGDSRDIVLHCRRNGPLQRISESHPAYAPLHYVLLFPHGTNGWHWSIPEQNLSNADRTHHQHHRQDPEDENDPSEDEHTNRRRTVTQTRYYAYQLQ
ncbi:hypothetical protein C8Q80DRAFT_346858, partial [Daedaleopsis nitida]